MERNDGPNAAERGGMPEPNAFSGSGSPPIDSFDFSGSSGMTGEASPTHTTRTGVREKLADVLESGAGRLRERRAEGGGGDANPDTAGATFAGVTGGGTVSVETDGGHAQVSERVAGGMDAAANWLREADLDGLKQGIERQVKEHPARTLAIAAGIGYLLGRAFRTNK